MEEELLICNAVNGLSFCSHCKHGVPHKERLPVYIHNCVVKGCTNSEYCDTVLCKCVPVKESN